MTAPFFPSLGGQSFASKSPVSATNVARGKSGREARTPLYQGLYEFELAFEGLASDCASNPGLGAQSLQAIMGLYLQCLGSFETFLYVDPTDNAVADQTVATGDGATTTFALGRAIGAGFDTSLHVTGVTGVAINGAGVSGWTLLAPNTLSFNSAPPSGAAITVSFSYAFVCRFLDDGLDFENFAQNLWSTRGVKFRSVRQ